MNPNRIAKALRELADAIEDAPVTEPANDSPALPAPEPGKAKPRRRRVRTVAPPSDVTDIDIAAARRALRRYA